MFPYFLYLCNIWGGGAVVELAVVPAPCSKNVCSSSICQDIHTSEQCIFILLYTEGLRRQCLDQQFIGFYSRKT